MSVPQSSLTKYPSASARELWFLAFPIMLSALSGNLMMFVDRLFLANYSLNAMNAVAIAGMACSVFIYAGVSIATIAEVFVGQHNGARRFTEVAVPVWQMIWFAAALWVIFIPLALFSGHWFIPADYQVQGIPYFQIIMLSAPLSSVIAAVSAFYIGRGRPQIVTVTTIAANLINFLLDWALILGVKGFIPAMGAKGAALATVASLLIQVIILVAVFLSREFKHRYHTHHFQWNGETLKQCLRIGSPNAVSRMIEIAAWAVLLNLTARVGGAYVTVLAIGQTLFMLLSFIAAGLEKGVMSIASNLLGSAQKLFIKRLFTSSLKLHSIYVVLLAFPLLIFPDFLIHFFLAKNTTGIPTSELIHYLRIACSGVWLYFLMDNFVWMIAGILTAAGDTLFVMFANVFNTWVFAVLPVCLGLFVWHMSPSVTWLLMDIYAFVNLVCFLWRYYSNRWYGKLQLSV